MIMVGEAGREHVTITPIDRPESRALKDGMTINFNNAIMSEDFTRDQIIPQIQQAVRMNLA
jgi:citrate lyase alpha subunit